MKPLVRFAVWLSLSGIAAAQLQIPEGTHLRVRLEQDLSSATAQVGQPVPLTVVDDVKVGATVVIPSGAAVAGRVVEAVPKQLTRSGKVDFSAEGVSAADGDPIPLRYTQEKQNAGGRRFSGLLGAGATLMFGPAVGLIRIAGAKDITVPKGTVVDLFTDQSHELKAAGPPAAAIPADAPKPAKSSSDDAAPAPKLVILSVASTPDGAQLTVDGTAIGETPASLQIDPGNHSVQIEKEGFAVWKRNITAKAGTPIDLDVKLEKPSLTKTEPTKAAPAKPSATPAPKRGANSAPSQPKSTGNH